MISLKQQLIWSFKLTMDGIEQYLFRLVAGLSVEDDKKLTKICEICEVEKHTVIEWRDRQKLKPTWGDILGFTYRFERLPNDDEAILLWNYGISLFVRLKRMNKIPV